jgi:catechol 2,3-dioxygenase
MPGLNSSAMATSSRPNVEGAIAPATRMGTVSLTVSDLNRSRAFYEETLGLPARELEDGELAFGAGSGRPLVTLHGDSSAPPLNRRATGLFHLAILHPSRLDLAHSLARVAETRWPLDGASDHLVSEALYLSDPDGNGIEIYRDRPRDEWRRVDGQLQMATLPLDLRSLADELSKASAPQPQAPAETTIGHVHLQVSELEQVESFYAGILGFDVMVRGYPGALFVAAGGYHHHLGLNTWQSAGSAPPEPGAVGLRSYEIVLPDAAELERVTARVSDAGLPVETYSALGGSLVRDPSGNALLLRTS